jgi:hypothetical protein
MVVLAVLLGWSGVAPAQADAQADALRAEVDAREAEVEAARASGSLFLPPLPPTEEGARALPSVLAALVTARARYLTAPDADRATRWEYELANAEVMFRYGQLRWALEAYRRVYRESCRVDGNVVERARGWIFLLTSRTHERWLLHLMARHWDAGVCLHSELEARDLTPPEPDPCAPSERPEDLARLPLARSHSPALELFNRAEEARAAGRPYVALYEASALELLSAIDRDEARPPECRSRDLPRALLIAGQALAYAHRPRAAADLMERAVAIAEHMPDADHLLAVGLFNAAVNARDAGDHDRALAHCARLYDEERFARSADPEMPSIRIDAMVEAARLLRALDRHAEAAALLDRIAADPDPESARHAALLALEERMAMTDANRPALADREALAEGARAFLAGPDLPIEFQMRALDVLVSSTRGRAHRDAEARLRALASALPLPGEEAPGAHHRIAARLEREAAARTRDRTEAARLLDHALARRVDVPETCRLLRATEHPRCRPASRSLFVTPLDPAE